MTHNNSENLNEDSGYDQLSDEMIALYKQHVPVYLCDLNTAFKANDEEAVKYQAHKISSVMGMVGLPRAQELLRRLEKEGITDTSVSIMLEEVNTIVENSLKSLG